MQCVTVLWQEEAQVVWDTRSGISFRVGPEFSDSYLTHRKKSHAEVYLKFIF